MEEVPIVNEAKEVKADRVLAQVVKVLALDPIIGADRIELATVLGWQVIVKKDEFQVGDLAIYFSIGAILSKDDPNTAFLNGKVLKTIRMRGTLSQGLLGPISWFTSYGDIASLKEDDDLTEKLNVKKWIPTEEMSLYTNDDGTKGPFPKIIRKTDEDRVQNAVKRLKELKDKPIIITQKYDGTSTTFMCLNNVFSICNRNNTLLVKTAEGQPYFEMANRYDLANTMVKLGKNIAVHGETTGQRKDGKYKINGNRHKLDDFEFYVFNIFDIDRQYYMNWPELLEITTLLKLKTVPVVYQGVMKDDWLSSKALIALATEQRYEGGQICEGIVIKSDLGYGFPRISLKAISNEYLLKYKL